VCGLVRLPIKLGDFSLSDAELGVCSASSAPPPPLAGVGDVNSTFKTICLQATCSLCTLISRPLDNLALFTTLRMLALEHPEFHCKHTAELPDTLNK
jgi:hypothetical protein